MEFMNRTKIGFFLVTAVYLTISLAITPVCHGGGFPPKSGYVEKVFDGDTILVESGGRNYKVRLLGVDTPEVDGPYTRQEPFGPQASAMTKSLALGKRVKLVYGGKDIMDKHGRLLAYVILPDGRDLNMILIREGLAEAFHSTKYTNKKLYHKLEKEAREAGKGLWRQKAGAGK